VDENVAHASWEERCKCIQNCANLTRIFANLLENCANHKANIANLLKIAQTYSAIFANLNKKFANLRDSVK